MFRQIIVFTKFQELPSIKGLRSAAKALGREFITLDPLREASLFLENHAHFSLDIISPALLMIRTSGIEFDDFDFVLAKHLEQSGVTLSSPLWALETLRNKDRQLLTFHTHGLPIVPSWFIRGELPENVPWETKESDPQVVLKSIRGNKGIGHRLLAYSQLKEVWKGHSNDQRYHIQPFLSEAKEVRLLVIGDRSFYLKRELGRDWRKNSDYSPLSLYSPKKNEDNQFQNLIAQIKDLLKMKVFAVDLILSEERQRWEILEVNSHPGVEAASEVIGKEIPLYQYIIEAHD